MTSRAAGNRRTAGRSASVVVAAIAIAMVAIARPVEAGETVATVQAFPPSVHLSTAQDRQSIVVQLVEANGITRDLTKDAALTLADPAVARIEGPTLIPLADGDTTLQISAGGQTLSVPVHVERAAEDPHLSFRLDIMPVFMRNGCNSGRLPRRGPRQGRLPDCRCLASIRRRLPAADPRDQRPADQSRRCPTRACSSTKATGAVPHARRASDSSLMSEYYATLIRWLEAGPTMIRPPRGAHGRKGRGLSARGVLDGQGATQQMTVRADYSDGTRSRRHLAGRVSHATTTTRPRSSPGPGDGGQNRGEAFIMARFDTQLSACTSSCCPKGSSSSWPDVAEHNYVDELVHAQTPQAADQPSDICSDEEFLRRASLDICRRAADAR